MKSILLIGLGRFGRHIALHLNELGHQVMAVDHVEERVPMQLFWNLWVSAIMMSVSLRLETIFKALWKRLPC